MWKTMYRMKLKIEIYSKMRGIRKAKNKGR